MIPNEELQQVAVQAAHDIRAPLAALAALERELGSLPAETRQLMSLSIARLREISAELLERTRPTRQVAAQPRTELVAPWIEALVLEKQAQHAEARELGFALEVAEQGINARFVPSQLQRVVSNLIDNAVEASGGRGKIRICLSCRDGKVFIRVIDQGVGMTPEVLRNVGREGFTQGKPKGHGLGVAHAIRTLEAWGGGLRYESVGGSGTTAIIELRESSSYLGAQS